MTFNHINKALISVDFVTKKAELRLRILNNKDKKYKIVLKIRPLSSPYRPVML
jgi:hypothetical protein